MSAREHILGRLRAARTATPSAPPDVAGWFSSRRRDEESTQRIARFRAALEAAHAEVHETGAGNWPETLLTIAREKGLRSLLIGANTPHGAMLEACGTESPRLVRYAAAIERWQDELFNDIDAALTLARSAIAETGSIILWPDENEPRLMSLVPPLHFVLVDADTLHADFHAAMTAENWARGLPTNALLVSGPSKTADIQQTLAYGAHGPRELVVLLRHAEEEPA